MSTPDDLKYTLDKLYRCRDLEISNLWQRSVFLSVFLILCFTAYGYLAIEMLGSDKIDNNKILRFGSAAIFIGCVSTVFSIVWILMGKASKAWYEVYEKAISEFEDDHHVKLGLPIKNIMGNMGFPQTQRNDSITSTRGGAFSPSRINIAIGQISLYLWILIVVFHAIINCSLINRSDYGNIFLIITISLPLLTFSICLLIVLTRYVKSGFLDKP